MDDTRARVTTASSGSGAAGALMPALSGACAAAGWHADEPGTATIRSGVSAGLIERRVIGQR